MSEPNEQQHDEQVAPARTTQASHPRRHDYTPQELEELLRGISPRRRAFSAALGRRVDAVVEGMRIHWLAIFNSVVALFVGLSLLIPVGFALGFTSQSSAVFNVYRIFCAQTPSHSFFIAGYQVCLCERCFAIYSSLLVGGLLLALLRSFGARGLTWTLWLVAMIPMALDGGTQLFGWRESGLGLRLFTGALFGIATAWFMLPQIEQALRGPQPALAQRRRG